MRSVSVLGGELTDRDIADRAWRRAVIVALRNLRIQRGWSQEMLGRRLGETQRTVSYFENHSSEPLLSSLQRYAAALDATIVVQLVPGSPGIDEPDDEPID